jgi:hypothetical protein
LFSIYATKLGNIVVGDGETGGPIDLDSLSARIQACADSLEAMTNITLDFKIDIVPWGTNNEFLAGDRHEAWLSWKADSVFNWTLQPAGGGGAQPWEDRWDQWNGGEGTQLLGVDSARWFCDAFHEIGHTIGGLEHTFENIDEDCDDSTREISGGDSAWNAWAGDYIWETPATPEHFSGCGIIADGWCGNMATSSAGYWSVVDSCRANNKSQYLISTIYDNALIDSIRVYSQDVGGGSLFWGVYNVDDGLPHDSIATGEITAGDGVGGRWTTASDSIPISRGTTYAIVIGEGNDQGVRLYYSATVDSASVSDAGDALPATWGNTSYHNQPYMVQAHVSYAYDDDIIDTCGRVWGDTCWANAAYHNYMSYTTLIIIDSGEFVQQQVNAMRCHLLFTDMKQLCGVWDPVIPFAAGDSDVQLGTTTTNDALLTIPRYPIGKKGDTTIVVVANNGTNQLGWAYTYDDNTWSSVNGRWMQLSNCGGATWYAADHKSVWFGDSGLWVAAREYSSGDGFQVRRLNSTFDAEGDWSPCKNPAAVSSYYPVVVASGTTTWVIDQPDSGAVNPSGTVQPLMCYASNNDFTDFIVDTVCMVPAELPGDPGCRVGATLDTSYNPIVSVLDFGTAWKIYRTSTGDYPWDSIILPTTEGANSRAYSVTQLNGQVHLIYGENSSPYPIVHFWDTGGGNFDSCIVTPNGPGILEQHPCVATHGTEELVLVYRGADSTACVKRWNATDGWDADSIVVSHDNGVWYPAIAPHYDGTVTKIWVFWGDRVADAISTSWFTLPAVSGEGE